MTNSYCRNCFANRGRWPRWCRECWIMYLKGAAFTLGTGTASWLVARWLGKV